MSETRIKAIIIYFVAITVAYLLKKVVFKIAHKAIKDKKLTTGIYRLFPVEGEQAVRLAKSYIWAVKIVFWLFVFIFPFMFFMSIKMGAL